MVTTKLTPKILLGARLPPCLVPRLVNPRLTLRSLRRYSVREERRSPQQEMAPQTMDSSRKREEMEVENPR